MSYVEYMPQFDFTESLINFISRSHRNQQFSGVSPLFSPPVETIYTILINVQMGEISSTQGICLFCLFGWYVFVYLFI